MSSSSGIHPISVHNVQLNVLIVPRGMFNVSLGLGVSNSVVKEIKRRIRRQPSNAHTACCSLLDLSFLVTQVPFCADSCLLHTPFFGCSPRLSVNPFQNF